MALKKRSLFRLALLIFFLALTIYVFAADILTKIGNYLVIDETPMHSDAVVVLNTGVEYYPRLIEAARLYKDGFTEKIVINGNRKTDALRRLEAQGFRPCCEWDEDRIRILGLMGVLRKDVISISAEDVYDTITEAETVGEFLFKKGFKKIIITTSKFHSRRSHLIWSDLFQDRLTVYIVSAKADPFEPKGWWKEGRQIRWVLAEYGALLYYWWRN